MKNKALEYIEKLCILYEDEDKTNLENTQKIIDKIYRFAHCVQESNGCYSLHEDWREELRKENWEI